MIKGIKGFIFDLDGVITDTSVLHESAWRKIAREEGIQFDETLPDRLRGVSRRRSLELILMNTDKSYIEQEIQALMDKKNDYYRESLEYLTPENLTNGAKELLDTLKGKGARTAIASSSKNARPVIEKLGISDKLDAVVDGTEIKKAKPDPEIFLKAAGKLGLPPSDCAVVEDAPSGIEAAAAGGFFPVAIGPKERFAGQKPYLRFNNLNELLTQVKL